MNSSLTTPVVCDLPLARRLERAEACSNAEFVEARAQAFPEVGAEWIDLAGTYAMYDGSDSPCTQTFGLGVFEPASGEHLDLLEWFFAKHRSDVFHEVCPLVDVSLVQSLVARGYQPIEFTNVLYRPVPNGGCLFESRTDSISVHVVEPGEEDLWARTAARGWGDVAPQLEEFVHQLARLIPHRPNTHCLLAEKGNEPIAAGAMSLFEGVALFAGACTIPEWRKQGAQRALLEHRLRFAAERDCDTAMIVAAPGSSSHRNAERQGFRVAYTRTKWRLPLANR